MVGTLVAAPALPGVGAVVGVRLLPAGIVVVVVTVPVIVPAAGGSVDGGEVGAGAVVGVSVGAGTARFVT